MFSRNEEIRSGALRDSPGAVVSSGVAQHKMYTRPLRRLSHVAGLRTSINAQAPWGINNTTLLNVQAARSLRANVAVLIHSMDNEKHLSMLPFPDSDFNFALILAQTVGARHQPHLDWGFLW